MYSLSTVSHGSGPTRPSPYRTGRLLPVLIVAFAIVLSGIVLVAPVFAASSDVRINEFSSNSPDFVELVNTGSGPVDLSGWVLKDSTENNSYTFPAGSSIAAGEIKGLSGEGVEFAFGLGNGDAVRLFDASAVLVDGFTYPAHPPAGRSYGRCPDGTGDFVLTQAVTKGAANSCSTPDAAVKINEFSSNSPDFVELINTGNGPVDLTGWVLKDNSENNSYTFPAGNSIAAGEIKGLSGEGVEFVFGLGNGDSVRLFNDAAEAIDSYVYPAHPAAGKSYGRCPNGTGAFVITAAATKGAANSCPVPPGAADIKVNEVRSDPDDIIELTNIGSGTVDLSGYILKDNDDAHAYVIAVGTTLAAGGFATFDVNVAFGLGKGDSARLYTPDGATLLDSTTYPADTHATTWGRCPDGTGDFGVTIATLGAANQCAPVGPPDVVINEVESNGDQVADWVELKNRATSPVNISGWKIVDGDPAHAATPVVVPAATTIPAGGYYAIYTELNQSPGFGLGVGDSVTVYLADGTTQIDTTTWGAHSPTTWGRCPDGTGAFADTTTATRGTANACSPVRINEVESDGGVPADWVELANISASPVDVSGYVLKDGDDAHSFPVPAGTTIPAKGYLVLDQATFGFELDATDKVRLFAADGTTLIESYSWASAALQSYGRCKDGVGDFKDTKAPTKGAANSCPGLETSPWPGAQTVTTADLTATFTQDLSGLAFDPADPDTLWAAQNKKGTLFKLARAGDEFVPVAGWPKDPKYPAGTGSPDTEGITIGPDGFVYLASERNNDASGISRMSILRYDPAATGTTVNATNEWDLTSKIPAAGANLGLEGVAWVPDSYLVAGGFKDQSTSAAYAPATYPLHGTGLYLVAVEDTGDLLAFALDSDGSTSHLVATIDSGFEHLADVSFDPELGRVRAVTDDTVDGKTSLLKIDGAGAFVVDAAYDRPVGMANLNNEGLAVAPQTRCVAGKKEVLWSDDGDTDGHSLRRGSINCTVLPITAPVPAVSGTPAVGQTLTAVPGTWGPAPVALTYQWFAGSTPITSVSASPTVVLAASQVEAAITVVVTGSKAGYTSVSKTSAPTAAVAKGDLVPTIPTISGSPAIGKTLTAIPGSWSPDAVTLGYRWYADDVAIPAATGSTVVLAAAQVGRKITVVVSGRKTGYTSTSRVAAPTAVVAAGTLTSVAPKITGTVKTGKILTVTPGAWKPAGVTFGYQWLANGKVVKGATKPTLTLTKSLKGKKISVKVTGSKAGYTSKSVTSAQTKVVS